MEMVVLEEDQLHPNIDEIIKNLQNKINRFFSGGGTGNKPIFLALIVVVIFGH